MEHEQTIFMDVIKEEIYNPWHYEEVFHDEDYLALEYQRSTSDKRRGEIAEFFVNRFLNLVKKEVGAFVAKQGDVNMEYKNYLRGEAFAYWNFIVCQKLQEFASKKGNTHDFVNILAVLGPWAREGVTTYMQEQVVWKANRYSNIEDDSVVGAGIDSDSFKAYETNLVSRCFDDCGVPIEGFEDIVRQVDAKSSIVEIEYLYDPRDANAWETMSNGLKIYKEQKKKEEKMTEEEKMRQVTGMIDRGRE